MFPAFGKIGSCSALGRVLAPRVELFSEQIARNVETGLGPLFCGVSAQI